MHRLPLMRLLWCGIGIATGLGLALLLLPAASPTFLASLGGSAVFLFGLTRAPAAQPRALFGGHLGGALVGIAGYQAFGDALWVYVLVEILALWLMLITKTVHPPAGANPLIMVHGHARSQLCGSPLRLAHGAWLPSPSCGVGFILALRAILLLGGFARRKAHFGAVGMSQIVAPNITFNRTRGYVSSFSVRIGAARRLT